MHLAGTIVLSVFNCFKSNHFYFFFFQRFLFTDLDEIGKIDIFHIPDAHARGIFIQLCGFLSKDKNNLRCTSCIASCNFAEFRCRFVILLPCGISTFTIINHKRKKKK